MMMMSTLIKSTSLLLLFYFSLLSHTQSSQISVERFGFLGLYGQDFASEDRNVQYTAAALWSLSLISSVGNASGIAPQNHRERVFTIVATIVSTCYFVYMFTTLMTLISSKRKQSSRMNERLMSIMSYVVFECEAREFSSYPSILTNNTLITHSYHCTLDYDENSNTNAQTQIHAKEKLSQKSVS